MTANELRAKYLNFFASKGHAIIPSASLVPENDASVLFTTAGMHPLVPYLLGQRHPAGMRLTSSQKCIRTGDIEEVGDDTHLTFFEMLGNWSLGDYFKKEAIEWSFEFLTSKEYLGIPLERLAFTCFAGDEDAPRDTESAEIWESLGVPQHRISFLPKEKNWWIAGTTGPCGPDTEMHYWIDDSSTAPDTYDPDEPRWVEIWNDVFMQFEKMADGQLVPLPKPNVDTGMGLERVLTVMNGQRSVYDTDLFKPLFEVIGKQQEFLTNDELRKARVICDHIRAATFMVSDGVEPSNKDRGYVLRRLLRRAMVFAKLLNLQGHWLEALVGKVAQIYGETYPSLVEESARIFAVIEAEQKKFGTTLEKGLKEFEKLIEKGFGVTGTNAFDLYQTYGFPWELTLDLATQAGLNPSAEEFKAEFKKHQDLSRTASAGDFKGGLANTGEKVVRLHTATHLMHKALKQVLGDAVAQKGSNITDERTRFDFAWPEKMTEDQKQEVETLVNSWIERQLVVKKEVVPVDEARDRGAIGLFGEKYGETVSIYTVLDPKTEEVISLEFCGGPHVENTGTIGKFKILKEESVSAGVRRIKAVIE